MREGIRYSTGIWVIKFFRLRLLSLSNDEIVTMINDYEKDSKALKHNILKQCWYMRGGLTYEEATMLSFQEREIINQIIKENLETTKDSGLPFF